MPPKRGKGKRTLGVVTKKRQAPKEPEDEMSEDTREETPTQDQSSSPPPAKKKAPVTKRASYLKDGPITPSKTLEVHTMSSDDSEAIRSPQGPSSPDIPQTQASVEPPEGVVVASQHSHSEISEVVETLPSPTTQDTLLLASIQNDVRCVSEYMRQNPDDNSSINWQYLLDVSSTLGHSDFVQLLEQSGKASNAQPLSDAAWGQQLLPEDTDYVTEAKRLATFEKWPSDKPQIQETLAKAGFWHTDESGEVQCYWCSGDGYLWEPTDDPWVLHAHFNPSCRHVQLARGREFVAEVTGYRSTPPVAASEDQLRAAATVGDTEYVRQCLASGREDGEVKWDKVLKSAYKGTHEETVRLIQDSGRVGIKEQMYRACQYDDHEHMQRVISEKRDAGHRVDWGNVDSNGSDHSDSWQDVDWDMMLKAAYVGKHEETVRMIQDSGWVGIRDQLYRACKYGDHEHVRKVINENRDAGQHVDWGNVDSDATKDAGQDVDWNELLEKACDKKHPAVMREIVSRRDTKYNRALMLASLDGELTYVQQHTSDFPANEEERKIYFMAAFYSNHKSITELLVKQDIVTMKVCAEDMYREGEHTDMVIYVINATTDIDMELRTGLTALHVTCCSWYPDIAILRALVSRGAEINKKGHRGRTAVHMLCQGQDDDIRKMIWGHVQVQPERGWEHGKVIKQQGQETHGANNEHKQCMKYLLQHGAIVNATDERGQSPLHLLACCQVSCVDLSRYTLLENKGNMEQQDEAGMTPLLAADDLPGQLEALLDNGGHMDQQDYTGMTPLALCALHDNTELMKILIKKGCDVNKTNIEGKSPLYIASEWGQLKAAAILANNPNVNIDHVDNDRVNPISIACAFGHTGIVSMLLSKKANTEIPDKDEKFPIHKAVEKRHHETVQLLLDHGINIDAQDILGNSPLHYAVVNDDKEITRLVIANNCNLDVVNNMGETPIITGIGKLGARNEAVIQILLENRDDLSIRNIYGDTVLSEAVAKLDYKLMLDLERYGIDFHIVNNKHQSLFHTLTNTINNRKCITEVTENIHSIMDTLDKHLSINATDINQQTPLHLAAHAGCVSTTNLLVQRGADVSVRDKFNFLPLMWAVPHEEVFRLLWEITVNHLSNEDWKILMKLGNWHNSINVTKEYLSKSTLAADTIDTSKFPQDFKRSEWFCLEHLEEFYTEDKRRLTFAEFEDAWLSSLQKLTYVDHSKIVDTLSEFIEDVLREVSSTDPLMSCFFRLSGSEREKCKVIATDEMDALSVMTEITFDMFEEPQRPDDPVLTVLKEFVRLRCKPEYREHLKRVLDRDHYLSRTKLYYHYSAALSQVLAKPELWAKYKNIQRLTHKDITAGNCTITPLWVIWSDDVYMAVKISIDMVPAIDLPKAWQLSWASQHPLLDEMATLIVPKWKTTAPENDNLVEVGVSHWAEVFDKMPTSMRNGYRMAKTVKEVCPQIILTNAKDKYNCDDWSLFSISECITSYMLKQCIVTLYAEVCYGKTDQEVPSKTDLEWAVAIYEMMENAFDKQELGSFFLPQYNLLHDSKFSYLRDKGIKYSQLCRQLLTERTAAHFRAAYMGLGNHDD